MRRWCFAGDTVSDLFRIQSMLNQHGNHSILERSHQVCTWWDYPLFFNRAMTQHTSRAIWPRKRVMECCIRWPGLQNHPTSTQLRCFGMSLTAEWSKSSQLSIRGNSKTVGKAFQVKLVERMPRMCKAVIKANCGYFEESQIYFDLFKLFGLLHGSVCVI